jgi:Tfp pilus assembly protein PilV
MKKLPFSCKGQSLFEVVVAIAISALIIVAIVSLTSNSIQNSSYSKDKTLAATYVQEANEWLREQRDSNMDTFATNASLSSAIDPKTLKVTWCLNNDLSTLTAWPNTQRPCPNGSFISGTHFTRQVVFDKSTDISTGKTIYQADVSVFWSDSKGIHQVTSSTTFSDLSQR